MAAPTHKDLVKFSQNSSTAPSFSFTVSSGSNQKLVVIASSEAGGGVAIDIATLKFGGVDLTRKHRQIADDGGAIEVEVWELNNPSVSTANIVGTLNTAPGRYSIFAFVVQDAQQIDPIVTSQALTTDTTTPPGLAITTTAADTRIFSVIADNLDHVQTASAPLTAIDNNPVVGQMRSSLAYVDKATAGSQTCTWTTASNYARAVQVNVAYAPYSAADLGTIVTEIPDHRGFPVGASQSTAVALSYTEITPNTLNNVQYRIMRLGVEIVTWAALGGSPVISGGTVTGGTVASPTGENDQLNLEFRGRDSGGTVLWTVASLRTFVVGYGIEFDGSSSLSDQHWFLATEQSGQTCDPKVVMYDNTAGTWKAVTGGGGVAMANKLVELTGHVFVFLAVANPGTGTGDWNSTGDPDPVAASAMVTLFGASPIAVCFHLSGDANSGTYASRTDAYNKQNTCLGVIRTRNGSTIPVFFHGGRKADGSANADTQWGLYQRPAELLLADTSNTYMGCSSVDQTVASGHVAAAGNIVDGKRMAHAIARRIYGQSVADRGPKMVESGQHAPRLISSSAIDVRFDSQNATALGLRGRTGSTGLTGFEVWSSDGLTQRTLTGAAILRAKTVRLASAAAFAAGDTVRYLNTGDPDTSNCLYDDVSAPT